VIMRSFVCFCRASWLRFFWTYRVAAMLVYSIL
jgi:hypothetical protein